MDAMDQLHIFLLSSSDRQLYSKICSDREDTLLLPATTLDTLTSTWFVSYFLSLL